MVKKPILLYAGSAFFMALTVLLRVHFMAVGRVIFMQNRGVYET
jgi:hypothetical protein